MVDMEPTELEASFHQLLALIPVAKEAETLEQILTNLDVDFRAQAGNLNTLTRTLLKHVNGDDFDNDPNREAHILRSLQILREHLGLQTPKVDESTTKEEKLHVTTPRGGLPKMPPLEHSPKKKFSGSRKKKKGSDSSSDSGSESSETSDSSEDEESSDDSAAESHLFRKKKSKK